MILYFISLFLLPFLAFLSPIHLPFTMINSKLNDNQSYNERAMITNLCFNNDNTKVCQNISLSFTDYIPWRCFEGNVSQITFAQDSFFITTSQATLSGKFMDSSFSNTYNKNIPIRYVKGYSYSDACYQLRAKYNAYGEIGFNFRDVNEQNYNNISLIEQLYNKTKESPIEFSLTFSSKENGEIILGQYQYEDMNELILELDIKRDYVRSFVSNSMYLSFNTEKSSKFQITNNLYLSITNNLTILPIKLIDNFLEMNNKYSVNNHNNLTFKDLCKERKLYTTFDFKIECEKEIENIILPTFTLTFDNKYSVTINPNEMWLDYKGKKIYCVGFTYISNNIILGQNFFMKYITIFDVKNHKVKLYSRKSKINKNSSLLRNVLLFSIILLSISLLILVCCLQQDKKRIHNDKIDYSIENKENRYNKL